MLLKTSSLNGLSIQARDGQIGRVSDLLFEDDTWQVRWLVVDAGPWLFGRKVLIPVSHLSPVGRGATSIPVDLTRKQVEDSPGSGTDLPVSRQMEMATYDHYGCAPYWSTPGMAYIPAIAAPVLPAAPSPATAGAPAFGALPRNNQDASPGAEADRRGDPHLRSAREVTGYSIHASDGDIGHVEDLLVESDGWSIHQFIVDTKNWLPGKRVLIEQDQIADIRWEERAVYIGQTRNEVKGAPEYDPSQPIDHVT